MPKRGGHKEDDHQWSKELIMTAYWCETESWEELRDDDLIIKQEMTIPGWFGIPPKSWLQRRKNFRDHHEPGTGLANIGRRGRKIYAECQGMSREQLLEQCRKAVREARDAYNEAAKERIKKFRPDNPDNPRP